MMPVMLGAVGKRASGPVVVLHDTFTDTGGTLLSAHTPEVGAWTDPLTASILAGFGSDRISAAATIYPSTQFAGLTDCEVLCTDFQSGASSPVAHHSLGGSANISYVAGQPDNWYVRCDRASLIIGEILAGTITSRATTAHTGGAWASSWAATAQAEAALQFRKVGQTIYARSRRTLALGWDPEISYTFASSPSGFEHMVLLTGTFSRWSEVKVISNPIAGGWTL